MKSFEWIKKRYIAHRGLHNDDFPENSIEAFKNAFKYDYDIEFDLRLTKDNTIVVIHDDDLSRLCGVNNKISKMKYDEIKSLTLRNTSSIIPLFTDILEIAPKSTNLMIELKGGKKNKTLVQQFLKIIRQYDFTYVVQSFNPRILNLLRKYAPEIKRGYLLDNQTTKSKILNVIIKLLPIDAIIKPDYYVYNFEDLPNKKMDKRKAQGFPVLSYTTKSQKDLTYIKNIYDNAVFEGFLPTNNE